MKKIFFFLSAIALLGLTAACVEQQEVNPNFNPETNEVKTAFAFNIMTNAQTKATALDVQESGNFLGMDNMYVYAFTGVPTDNSVMATSYSLGSLTPGEIGNSETTPSSKIYNLAIKTGTDNMIFYGKAKSNYGAITVPTISATTVLSGVNWALESILGSGDFSTPSGTIANKLNAIITDDWADVATYFKTNTNTTHARYADYKTLVDLYNNLTTVNTGEIRQGSGQAVCAMVKDLYNALKMFVSTASTNGFTVNETTSYDSPKVIAQAIVDAIGDNFTVDATSGVVTVTLGGTLDDFPTSLGLPAGAAQLAYTTKTTDGVTTSQFEYVTTPGAFDNTTVSAIAKFMKPAALYYWVNSPVFVSSYESLTADNYPKTTITWSADSWSGVANWAQGAVTADTRGVALKNNIQYANAMLKSSVQYKQNDENASSFKLYDNRKHFMPLEEDQEFTIDNSRPFEFKGIIIGGQPEKVAWNWIPTTAASANNYAIYDVTNDTQKALPTSTGSTSSPLYTLVLDNYTNATNQADVAVAIELVNKTGKNIWGRDNMIPIDGTFYLVGKLNASKLPDASKLTINKDTRAPHLTANDFVPRIFMQDYVTVANFMIDEQSLKNAYSTIPDLRSTMMTFGISVDLQWLAGGNIDVQL